MGKLERIKISSFSDNNFKVKISEKSVIVNPEFESKKISLKNNQEVNDNEFSLTLFFDGTGKGFDCNDVKNEIDDFTNIMYSYSGEVQSANNLVLSFERFTIKCRLIYLKIDYILFTSGGDPLRAVVKCEFEKLI